jgi:hypothetical protein
MNKPRVFENGSVTIVSNDKDIRLYVGVHEIKKFSKIELIHDKLNKLIISIDGKSIESEESERILSTLTWVTIKE